MSKLKKTTNKRVIVHVSGGLAECVSDPGVDCLVLYWDAICDGNAPPTMEDIREWRDQYRGLLDGQDVDRLEILAGE
jgi:hypothetical protein